VTIMDGLEGNGDYHGWVTCKLEIKPFTNKGPMDYGVQLLRDQNLTCN
jgi:hypothetical protein